MKIKITHNILTIVLVTFMASCLPTLGEEIIINDDNFQGTERDIENFYTPEALEALRNLGLVINEGNSPPNINGVYMTQPMVLEATNILDDPELGFEFANIRFAVSNQNNDSLTLNFSGFDVTSRISVIASFISGSGNQFSVYLKVSVNHEPTGSNGIFAYVFSGTKNSTGLQNFSYGLMMVDDSEDFSNIFINNNEGRRFSEKDGLVEQWATLGDGQFNGSLNSLSGIFPSAPIQGLRSLGIIVNEGQNPPQLNGSYNFDPDLTATTRGERDNGIVFEELFDIEFRNQNPETLQVDFDAKEYDTPNFNYDWLQGVKSFVSGSGNKFSVYSLGFEYDANLTYQPLSLYIFSGELTNANQVTNFTYGLYMINTGSIEDTFYIDNGDARRFMHTSLEGKQKFIVKRRAARTEIGLPSSTLSTIYSSEYPN